MSNTLHDRSEALVASVPDARPGSWEAEVVDNAERGGFAVVGAEELGALRTALAEGNGQSAHVPPEARELLACAVEMMKAGAANLADWVSVYMPGQGVDDDDEPEVSKSDTPEPEGIGEISPSRDRAEDAARAAPQPVRVGSR